MLTLLTVGLLTVGLVAGCTGSSDEPAPAATGPVPAPPPASLPPAAAAACADLLAALPGELDPGVRRRPVEGDDPRAAAWGDPAVVLLCGVPRPDRPDEPASVNGVLWSVRDVGAGFLWTTSELGVAVSVEVPDAYDNPAELVNPLAEPLRSTLPGPSPSPAAGS